MIVRRLSTCAAVGALVISGLLAAQPAQAKGVDGAEDCVAQVVEVGGELENECAPAPIPTWQMAYALEKSTDECLTGWNPSWQQWPHGGRGGYVCVREVASLG